MEKLLLITIRAIQESNKAMYQAIKVMRAGYHGSHLNSPMVSFERLIEKTDETIEAAEKLLEKTAKKKGKKKDALVS